MPKDETKMSIKVGDNPAVNITSTSLQRAVDRMNKAADDAGIPRTTPASAGDNSKKKPRIGGVAVEQLRSIIQRIERLEEEKSGIAADIRDVFAEAKGNGFHVKAIRKIIKLRQLDAQQREEEETILDTYMRALGMQPDLFDEDDKKA